MNVMNGQRQSKFGDSQMKIRKHLKIHFLKVLAGGPTDEAVTVA